MHNPSQYCIKIFVPAIMFFLTGFLIQILQNMLQGKIVFLHNHIKEDRVGSHLFLTENY